MKSERIICSGFGGQGVMSLGQILAYSGLLENNEVSWLPSYGPEMRGGTANCSVTISKEKIASPIIDRATVVIVMNNPSLKKFEEYVSEGGILLINSSLVNEKPRRKDIRIYQIPASELAVEMCKNPKVANMIMLGAYLKISRILEVESILKGFLKVFGEGKANLLPLNKTALEIGRDYIDEDDYLII